MSIENLHNIWPEWKLERFLGGGSYGQVYEVSHTDFGITSRSAIKVISVPRDTGVIDSLIADGYDDHASPAFLRELVSDLVNEIVIMESFKSFPNIVSIEDYKVVEHREAAGWDIFIRMELLTPLNIYMSDRMLTEADMIKLGYDLCSALEVMHHKNIIHRDIKPENIFVNEFGNFKLGDFGTAKKIEMYTLGMTQNRGTPLYMAPEIGKGGDYDPRADLYSVGIVLYRLLNNNRLPFMDTDKQLLSPHERRTAVERRWRGEPLPPPRDASPEMADLILRACSYDPKLRFESAEQMKQAFQSIASGSYQMFFSPQTPPTDELTDPKLPPKSQKAHHPLLIAAILLIGIIIGIAGIIGIARVVIPSDKEDIIGRQSGSTEDADSLYQVSSSDSGTDSLSDLTVSEAPETAEETEASTTADMVLQIEFRDLTLTGGEHDSKTIGRNRLYLEVRWILSIKLAKENYPFVENISCSWENDPIDITGMTDADAPYWDFGWSAACEGKTLYNIETDQYGYTIINIMLPSNPDISGKQSVTLDGTLGGIRYEKNMDFILVWQGDYINGTGWHMYYETEAEIMHCHSFNNDKREWGVNEKKEPVNWYFCIQINKMTYLKITDFTCSWDSSPRYQGEYESYRAIWQDVYNGETVYNKTRESSSEFYAQFMLPNRPELEGPQTVTLEGDKDGIRFILSVNVDFESLGDYTTGNGWSIKTNQ